MANIETELKYLVDKIPPHLDFVEFYQIYFDPSDLIDELSTLFHIEDFHTISTSRIRKVIRGENVKYVVTLKTKGALSRLEYEEEVSFLFAEKILSQPILSIIHKKRYFLKENDLTFEFDEYLNLGIELNTVEVELPTVDVQKFIPLIENTFNKYQLKTIDVSLDPRYKNSNLIKFFKSSKTITKEEILKK